MRRLLLAGAAVLTGRSGVLLGTAPSGIEPGGEWFDCGRALFHDRNRLPHPDCAASYEPFQSAAITLVVISVVLLFLVPFQRTGPDCSVGDTDKRPGRWALLTGLAAVALLTGCAALDRTPDPGPLGEGAGEDSGEICVPASPRGEYAFGAEVLHNPSGDDAVITGLRLVDAKGVELVGAVVVDLNGSSSVGARTSWPPSGQENTPQWKAAVPADGATIPAGSTHQKNLVLHLRAPSQPASLGSYKVAYEVDGDEYEMQTTLALQIKGKCF